MSVDKTPSPPGGWWALYSKALWPVAPFPLFLNGAQRISIALFTGITIDIPRADLYDTIEEAALALLESTPHTSVRWYVKDNTYCVCLKRQSNKKNDILHLYEDVGEAAEVLLTHVRGTPWEPHIINGAS